MYESSTFDPRHSSSFRRPSTRAPETDTTSFSQEDSPSNTDMLLRQIEVNCQNRDYHRCFNLPTTSPLTQEDFKRAYKKLLVRIHPDKLAPQYGARAETLTALINDLRDQILPTLPHESPNQSAQTTSASPDFSSPVSSSPFSESSSTDRSQQSSQSAASSEKAADAETDPIASQINACHTINDISQVIKNRGGLFTRTGETIDDLEFFNRCRQAYTQLTQQLTYDYHLLPDDHNLAYKVHEILVSTRINQIINSDEKHKISDIKYILYFANQSPAQEKDQIDLSALYSNIDLALEKMKTQTWRVLEDDRLFPNTYHLRRILIPFLRQEAKRELMAQYEKEHRPWYQKMFH